MVLSFSQKFKDGSPNYFVDKIWTSLISENNEISISDYEDFTDKYYKKFNYDFKGYKNLFIEPKIHTIRKDEKNRWKAGNKIHFVINNRTTKRFQFAPVVKCTGIQEIFIHYDKSALYRFVKIDGRQLSIDETKQLADNFIKQTL